MNYYQQTSFILKIPQEAYPFALDLKAAMGGVDAEAQDEIIKIATEIMSDQFPETGFVLVKDGDDLWVQGENVNEVILAKFIKAILKKFEVAGTISFEWANTCDKPCEGAFSGGACCVSRWEAVYHSTTDWITATSETMSRTDTTVRRECIQRLDRAIEAGAFCENCQNPECEDCWVLPRLDELIDECRVDENTPKSQPMTQLLEGIVDGEPREKLSGLVEQIADPRLTEAFKRYGYPVTIIVTESPDEYSACMGIGETPQAYGSDGSVVKVFLSEQAFFDAYPDAPLFDGTDEIFWPGNEAEATK